MIYIIPIIHELQSQNPSNYPYANDFVNYLKQKIAELNIQLLADEWSEDGMNDHWGNTSNVEDVANELKIEYRAIDPSKKRREELNIPSLEKIVSTNAEKLPFFSKFHSFPTTDAGKKEKLEWDILQAKYFPKREKEWFNNIKDNLHENIILTCGSNHVSCGNKHISSSKGFDVFLLDKGYDVQILTENFYINPFAY
jgi:hypothetical protein